MKLPIQLDETSRSPIYHQIEEQIKALIVSGHLEPGSSLPSIRVMSKDLACSVITTKRAYHNLEEKGLIRTLQGKGTFVADVDTGARQHFKEETVERGLLQAIAMGRQHNYSDAELLKLFERLLNK
ncbi:GntR family transcriptional regulator [Alkalicoccobacillus murimartini]|uniref:GntR family transcriptional regulator n=1 Tax=Alkalicoccobacillus murimartini TaxID=171685 RepID=A0ABT9YGW4_9BACI|nr:GntR family transcriptional regulator [Alkalicoccobacillus murimartini]MDQ0207100.1 GntR family transcriptional regulator [Alkalicoccobacillus murimartini]